MDRLINAVLKLSREGRRDFTPQEVDMNAMVASIVQSVAHRYPNRAPPLSLADLPAVSSEGAV
jgi:light-regulated signal transduction histidine kinase (bacteriophytochrome)